MKVPVSKVEAPASGVQNAMHIIKNPYQDLVPGYCLLLFKFCNYVPCMIPHLSPHPVAYPPPRFFCTYSPIFLAAPAALLSCFFTSLTAVLHLLMVFFVRVLAFLGAPALCSYM